MNIFRIITYSLLLTFIFYSNTIDASMKCFGTEPFWSLDIKSKKAIYKDISETVEKYDIIKIIEASGLKPGIISVYEMSDKNKNNLKAVIQKQNCTDDMSDNIYPYEIIFIKSDKTLYGCCN